MASLSIGYVAFATSLLMISEMTSEKPAAAGPGDVALTERQYDQPVTVASGDHVLLRLPMSLPMAWAPVKGKEVLRQVKSPPPPPDHQETQSDIPNVGGFSLSNLRYQVSAQPGSTVTIEWMYCYLGSPEKTEKRLAGKRASEGHATDESPPPFRPGLRPEQLDEGMIYRVKLKVVPSEGSSPHGVMGGLGDVVLTERQYDQAVTVASNDHVLLRLPMSLPMTWAPVKGKDILRQVKAPPPPPERQAPLGDIPNVGGFSPSNLRYQVIAEPGSTVTVEWVYCYLGSPERTAQRLKEKRAQEGQPADATPPPFRPDLRPEDLEEGMIYRVKLNAVLPRVPSKE